MAEGAAQHVSKRAVVRGRVQGVGFRGWTEAQARALGLSGWVRNLTDGAVEGLFQGPAQTVERMLQALQHGPRSAKVEQVEVSEGGVQEYEGFSIRR